MKQWDGVKKDVWRGRVKGKPADPGSHGRMSVKPACHTISVVYVNTSFVNCFTKNK